MATGPCEWVEVDCPNCLNANRAARRHCDWCDGTGKVIKSLPLGPDISTSSIDIYQPKDRWYTTDGIPVLYLGGPLLKQMAKAYPVPEVVHVGD